MQFEFQFPGRRAAGAQNFLEIGAHLVPLRLALNRRARRYVLRLQENGVARVTIPRGGSQRGAREFARSCTAWLRRQLERRAAQARPRTTWVPGTEVLLRGGAFKLEPGETGTVWFDDQTVRVGDSPGDYRPAIERHLRRLAARELPPRVAELAALHQVPVRRVQVRDQKSRWGSCSARGTISLNWRLIQMPAPVRDYLILHELTHVRHLNHSGAFWRQVQAVCPDYAQAEQWLRQHGARLR